MPENSRRKKCSVFHGRYVGMAVSPKLNEKQKRLITQQKDKKRLQHESRLKRTHTAGVSIGGGEGSRTPVRKQFHGIFSGRRRLLRAALPPCSPSDRQAVTPEGQVRVMMHGTVNSFRTHVHC